METLIIYHRDMDGLASALIARKRYPNAGLISVQYGEDIIDRDTIIYYKGKRLVLVDFSFNRTVMDHLLEEVAEFIWIDHHKTAKEALPELWEEANILGIRDMNHAACELTWAYFNPTEETPYGIELIGDRDTWTFKYKEDTKYFHEYLRQYDIETDITAIDMEIFEDANNINECIDEGKILYDHMLSEVSRIYKKGTVSNKEYINSNHYNTFICHSNSYISELANYALGQAGCDIAEIRQRIYDVKKGWMTIVSLRSKANGVVDVSEIARDHDGGGHFHAAGYVLK